MIDPEPSPAPGVDRPDLDAVIVGGGLSGLVAAERLRVAGKRVRVLEARERVGGRTLTVDFAGGAVDLGGQWIGPTQESVLKLTRELGLETYEQFQEGEKLFEFAGEIRRYRGLLPKISLFGLAELGLVMARLDRMARRIPREAPWQARRAKKWDAIDFSEWLRQHVDSLGARTCLRIATEAVFAAHPREISLLYFLHYIRSSGGLDALTRIDGGAQNWKIKGGAQQLSLRLAERIGSALALGQPVHAISQDEQGVTVQGERGEYRAKRLILAMAPGLVQRIDFTPPLAATRLRLQESMKMGRVIKAVLAYQLPFWRSLGLSGEALSQSLSVRMVFDGCGPGRSTPARLVAFVLGDQADRLGKFSPTIRRETIIADLVRMFGPDAAAPSGYIECNWAAEEWSQGCYVGLLGPGRLGELGPSLRGVEGRIHFAGTEAATRWVGYLEGAIESGERAAAEVMEGLG